MAAVQQSGRMDTFLLQLARDEEFLLAVEAYCSPPSPCTEPRRSGARLGAAGD